MSSSDQTPEKSKKKKPMSMHEGVPDWYDPCPCEAEPYWEEIGEQMEREKKDKAEKAGEQSKKED